MNNFTWNPNDYASSSSAQLVWAKELIKKFNLKGNEYILDIGCGDGKITAEISHYLPEGKIIGIDSSKEMIDYALLKFPKSDYPNLEFYDMDARSFSLNEKFDMIFSNAALHWFKDHLSVLKCAAQVMKPKARILISCGGKGNADDILDVMNKRIMTNKWELYFKNFNFVYSFYGTDEYPAWIGNAGLKLISIRLIPKDMIQEGREGLAGWLRTTWLPYTHCVPDNLREEFVFDIVDTYLKDHPVDGNGKAHVNMVRLEVEAAKL